ncbi:MAG: hypothetical protein JOZ36_05360 [Acidobacteria bacterium]|nr:hypothetical protein [Acidobacteriota bacterium]
MSNAKLRTLVAVGVVCLTAPTFNFASAYDAHPRRVVVIMVDRLRGDSLERRDRWTERGFRLSMNQEAYYEFSGTRAPASILGIDVPTRALVRVLTEVLASRSAEERSGSHENRKLHGTRPVEPPARANAGGK